MFDDAHVVTVACYFAGRGVVKTVNNIEDVSHYDAPKDFSAIIGGCVPVRFFAEVYSPHFRSFCA